LSPDTIGVLGVIGIISITNIVITLLLLIQEVGKDIKNINYREGIGC
jgi:hypothetical protein